MLRQSVRPPGLASQRRRHELTATCTIRERGHTRLVTATATAAAARARRRPGRASSTPRRIPTVPGPPLRAHRNPAITLPRPITQTALCSWFATTWILPPRWRTTQAHGRRCGAWDTPGNTAVPATGRIPSAYCTVLCRQTATPLPPSTSTSTSTPRSVRPPLSAPSCRPSAYLFCFLLFVRTHPADRLPSQSRSPLPDVALHALQPDSRALHTSSQVKQRTRAESSFSALQPAG
eukprot:COSAG06_NODE_9493_length_1887_cov_3.115213_3_plen_234_part_01